MKRLSLITLNVLLLTHILGINMPPPDVDNEFPVIMDAAKSNGLTAEEAMFLVAMRFAENGGTGFEYGVKKVKGTNLRTQAGWAAASIANNRARYDKYLRAGGAPNYTLFFAHHGGPFGRGFAPVEGVPQGEKELNVNWSGNVDNVLSREVSTWMPRIKEFYDESDTRQALKGKEDEVIGRR